MGDPSVCHMNPGFDGESPEIDGGFLQRIFHYTVCQRQTRVTSITNRHLQQGSAIDLTNDARSINHETTLTEPFANHHQTALGVGSLAQEPLNINN